MEGTEMTKIMWHRELGDVEVSGEYVVNGRRVRDAVDIYGRRVVADVIRDLWHEGPNSCPVCGRMTEHDEDEYCGGSVCRSVHR
jgi:hypothetical protein